MLYELILRAHLPVAQVINRWHYNMSGTPAAVSGSFALTSAFGLIDAAGVYPAGSPFRLLKDFLSSDLSFDEAQVTAMYDVEDFYVRPFPTPTSGGTGESIVAPFVAYGIQSNRTRTDIRRGSKRFAGVVESKIEAGGFLSAGAISSLSAIAAAMSTNLTYDDEGNTLTFAPVVLSYEKYTAPSGEPAYRPYATEAAQLSHMATGIAYTAMDNVRSQTSRQRNRGA